MSQRTRNIILWIVAIGLLISMAISFTPGQLFGNQGQQDAEGAAALNVNGQPIGELEISRLEQQPPFNAIQEGPVAEDLQLVLLDELVNQSLVQQAASGESVSTGEVRDQVNEFRASQNVAGRGNDRNYLNLLAGAGYTDDSFRELMREQLQQEKYIASLTEEAEVTDAELTTYFETNRDAYQTEPRITAREIVVATKAEADRLYALALSGEDFATLARENSSERAEQGGALGATEENSDPQPVTSVALPTAVSEAAFALQGPGLTTPVEAGGAFHVVNVEAFSPAEPRPLEDVRDEVQSDALELKKAGVQEEALLKLRDDATIASPEGSAYTYNDRVVARVGDDEIKATELDRATYLNPQIQQLLNPDSAELISDFLKPNNLSQLIDQELAYQGAAELGAAFVGTRSAIGQSARSYVARDEQVTPAQVTRYYNQNRANYTVPATVLATRVNFSDEAAAEDFAQALGNGGGAVDDAAVSQAADEAGGTVQALGSVTRGSQPPVLERALFNFTNGMTALGESGYDVSNVLTINTPSAPMSGGAASGGAASGGAVSGGAGSGGSASGGANVAPQLQFVVLVAARAPARVRPLGEVRALASQAALFEQQTEAQQVWLDGLREDINVENILADSEAEATEAQQTAAATAAAAAQALMSGGVASGGSVSGGAPSGEALPSVTPPTTLPATPESGGAN